MTEHYSLNLQILSRNDAFQDGVGPREVRRILRQLGEDIVADAVRGKLYDANGNVVGTFRLDVEQED